MPDQGQGAVRVFALLGYSRLPMVIVVVTTVQKADAHPHQKLPLTLNCKRATIA